MENGGPFGVVVGGGGGGGGGGGFGGGVVFVTFLSFDYYRRGEEKSIIFVWRGRRGKMKKKT